MSEKGGKRPFNLVPWGRMEDSTSDSSPPRLQALTEREKETLRLLLRGYDAKSIARDLGLSVHTVNERLRDARRKLNVSSSREAARRLAGEEQDSPKIIADKHFGVAREPTDGRVYGRAGSRPYGGHRLVWLTGGMLVMSLVIAAAAVLLAFHGEGGASTGPAQPVTLAEARPETLDPAATDAARAWVALLDTRHWEESWGAGCRPVQVANFRSAMGLCGSIDPAAAWSHIITYC